MPVVVSESAVGDLDVLDTLELFQSSCSRRYRSFGERFDFGFDRVDGVYRPTRNFDMLADLRQAALKRRVRQGSFRYGIGWQMQGLIDYWIGGLLDYGSLLEQPLQRLHFERVQVDRRCDGCSPLPL